MEHDKSLHLLLFSFFWPVWVGVGLSRWGVERMARCWVSEASDAASASTVPFKGLGCGAGRSLVV